MIRVKFQAFMNDKNKILKVVSAKNNYCHISYTAIFGIQRVLN